MFGRIIGNIWKGHISSYPSSIRRLNSIQLQCFARKVNSKKDDNTKQGQTQSEKVEEAMKSNKVLTKKEQIELLGKLGEEKELTRDEIMSLTRMEQRDREMAENIMKESTFSEYDKQIDELIDKKMKAGESAGNIIKAILGASDAVDEQDKSQEYIVEDDNESANKEKETAEKFNAFASDLKMNKELQGYGQLYDILESNRDKADELKLSELPIHQQYKLNRKLTEQEKFDIEARVASVSAYVQSPYADPKNIPKQIKEEIRIFEQGEPDRLSLEQRNQLLYKVRDSAIDAMEERKALAIKKKTILAQKLHASEIDEKEDKRFKALVEQDSKNTELQVDAPTDQEKRALKKDFSESRRNTFLIQNKHLLNAAKTLGVNPKDYEDKEDMEVLMQISKEDLFIKKKLSEEDAQFQKKLQRRNRIKELQKFEESLNTHKFKQDIDYTDPSQNFKGAKVPAHDKFSDLPDLEKLKALQDKYNDLVDIDSNWDIHKKRSMKGVSSYIRGILEGHDKNSIQSVIMDKDIQVDRISCNPAITVIYVFWQIAKPLSNSELNKMSQEDQALRRFKDMMLRRSEENQANQKVENEELLNKRLNKFGKYLSGRMCRDLGFKYGPDIRFFVSKKNERSLELKREIGEVVPDIIKKKLLEKYEKGEIERRINKGKLAQEIDRAVIDLEAKLEENSETDESLIAQAKAALKREKELKQGDKRKNNKKVHNHRDSLGNKLRRKENKKRAKKSQEFWESLDAY